jgi:hypothetical protein
MDDDDKIRRNLVVTSFLILIAAWFNIQVNTTQQNILFKVFTTKPLAIQNVWTIALIVLTYFSIRFFHSDQFSAQWESIKLDFYKIRKEKLETMIALELANKNICRFTGSKMPIKNEPFTHLDTILSNLEKSPTKATITFKVNISNDLVEIVGPLKLDITITSIIPENQLAPYTIEINHNHRYLGMEGSDIFYSTTHSGDLIIKIVSHVYSSADMQFSKITNHRINTTSSLRIFLKNKAGINLFTPVVLAVLAFLICGYKLL